MLNDYFHWDEFVFGISEVFLAKRPFFRIFGREISPKTELMTSRTKRTSDQIYVYLCWNDIFCEWSWIVIKTFKRNFLNRSDELFQNFVDKSTFLELFLEILRVMTKS